MANKFKNACESGSNVKKIKLRWVVANCVMFIQKCYKADPQKKLGKETAPNDGPFLKNPESAYVDEYVSNAFIIIKRLGLMSLMQKHSSHEYHHLCKGQTL